MTVFGKILSEHDYFCFFCFSFAWNIFFFPPLSFELMCALKSSESVYQQHKLENALKTCWDQHCDVDREAVTCDAAIPYVCWFISQLFHVLSSFLLMPWEKQWRMA